MTDTTANTQAPLDLGTTAMSRLADRLASVAPPRPVTPAQPIHQFSPAVSSALARSAQMSKRAAARARGSRSFAGAAVDTLIAACAALPYAVVALALRLVMARIFFLDGQTRIEGPRVPLSVPDALLTIPGLKSISLPKLDIALILPAQVKGETVATFLTQYAALPLPPMVGAYALSYAEFILPIMLVIGFGTRFAALGLLVITAMIQIFVMPQALWSTHIYWASMLLVLISLGAGKISIDHIIRMVTRRS
jgi:putative oxidoreductase